ncbi:hypothetical protein RND81_02G187300 [Saponaria officinalis]|uniref:GAG-pre-integrase domain-containing protein n=1 Tax=Saponaria officinalis TaxID=3572 RepID=A0AAW1MMP2_SAPOF
MDIKPPRASQRWDKDDKTPLAKIESSSPFFIGPQDRTDDFITPIRLKLDNFDDWSHAMRAALRSLRKFGFLNGTIKSLEAPATQDDWETVHCMLVSWLMNTIDPEVKSFLSNYDDAKRLWDDLHERFSLDSDHLHQFLLGLLPDLYGSLRSERVRGIDRAKENIAKSTRFTVRTSPRPPSRIIRQLSKTEKKALFCTHCMKSGHGVTMCFDILEEIPDWWYKLMSAKPQKKSSHGASARVWSSRGDVGNGSNVVHIVAADAPTTSGSQSQIMLYSTPSHHLTGKWIIDMGCSHHVIGDLAALIDVLDVPSRPIRLPDGQQVHANKIGRVDLTSKIMLDRVLYEPHDTLNCEFITNSTLCTIQDLSTRTVIGMGDRLDGLYYLRPENNLVANVVDVVSSLTLSHHRLGHPSVKVVKLLPFLTNTSSDLSQPCEVCHRAKQVREPIPSSSKKSSGMFEVLHCDLNSAVLS